MNGIVPQKHINVAGIEIAQDQAGRYCLNDLHRAAMAGGKATESHRPGNFLKTASVEAFNKALSAATEIAPVEVINGGQKQGSYGVELIVMRYAAWIDPGFEVQVYQTFQAATKQRPAAPEPTAMDAAKMFTPFFRIARLIGCDKNASAISANNAVHSVTGTNVLALMGQTHLTAEVQELCFTPTELGDRLCMSGQAFNQRLAERGMQERISGKWVPTDRGAQFAVILDTGKATGHGAPVQQVKWRDSVMSEVAV